MDGSAGNRAHISATTFSLGIRHAAVSVETPRHGVQLELPRTWLVQSAQRVVFPDHTRGGYAHVRFVPFGVPAFRLLKRGVSFYCPFPTDGCDPRHPCLPV